MKKYTLTYRGYCGEYLFVKLEATCDTDARFIARDFYRKNFGICALSLMSFSGRYIEI